MLRILRGGAFTAKSEGKLYGVVPNGVMLNLIETDRADFGLLGSDKYDEADTIAAFEKVEQLSCGFVLAVPAETGLKYSGTSPRIATSYPRALARFGLRGNLKSFVTVNYPGKVEGTIDFAIADAIYDIRETGASLRENNLHVLSTGPVITLGGIWKGIGLKAQPELDIAGYLYSLKCIEAKAERLRQGSEPVSYTERMMSSTNELVKKLGSEQAEFLQALLRAEFSRNETINEAADMVYAITAALAIKGISMQSVITVLTERNQKV